MLTGLQIREARGLLGWGRAKMGREADLSPALLVAVESSDGPAWLTEGEEAAFRRVYESAGVEFTPNGPRLRQERG